ncbi:MAG: hypothetical protein M9924_14875 [Rhizobiaceae bacterium]|nr:hypothetical protein [Rhizobiaceae bacterium]
MPDGLTKAFEADCGGVTFSLWYTRNAKIAHMRDLKHEKFGQDCVAMVVTNDKNPSVRNFCFTEPKPLAFFGQLFRNVDGNWVDITDVRIGPMDTGDPFKKGLAFNRGGDSWEFRLAYPALTTIARRADLDKGDYLLRLLPYAYLEVEGQPFEITLPDLPIHFD